MFRDGFEPEEERATPSILEDASEPEPGEKKPKKKKSRRAEKKADEPTKKKSKKKK